VGIRLGVTPRGPSHSKLSLSTLRRKPDISTWQRLGHFYLALTVRRGSRDRAKEPGKELRVLAFPAANPIAW
jgi:hypothetical protein